MIYALEDWRQENSINMAKRADAFRAEMKDAKGWALTTLGAYFGYVRHPFDEDSITVAERMTREAGLLTIPGDFFGKGQSRYLRFAFANVDIPEIKMIAGRLNKLTS